MTSAKSSSVIDPAHDVLRYVHRPLDAIFAPRNVAVIGATEKQGSVGRAVLWNLISNPFGGTVFPVNPTRPSVLGIRAYPSIKDVPEQVDLAVIVTPAPTVPGLISQCADVGVKGAIVISAGFKEVGAAGVELERQVLEQARRVGMRLIGPNCLGVINPFSGLNATFAAGMAKSGRVAFLSQSGALGTAVLDWSVREGVGFSAFVSMGSMLDVDWGDLIDYLGDDPHTKSILIYMESVGDAKSFLSAAREVAYTKPIIIIKAGRTESAAHAAASHTGALAGSDEVFDAALRRCGVLRVTHIGDLFHMADVLAKQPRPMGPRLTILTNAGGPGVLATDALITGGGKLAKPSDATRQELAKILPASASTHNPIDILGDADPDRYAKALQITGRDKETDGLLVVLTPQAMTDPTRTAEQIRATLEPTGKPVLTSWMGGPMVESGRGIFNAAGIPTFQYPDDAAQIFNYMWRYTYSLQGLYETPEVAVGADSGSAAAAARKIIDGALAEGRSLLTEAESKQLLATYGIPVVSTQVAETSEAAVKLADGIGYPVVLKLHSRTITHKTDVGGVKLNLADAAAVRDAFQQIKASVTAKAGAEHFNGVSVQPMISGHAYEIILGSSIDPQFGPVILFGMGGELVEVFKDRALGLPPLNTTLARRLMEQTKIHTALGGVRGRKSADMAALQRLLVCFSQLVVDLPRIKEIDINPLRVSSERIIALDGRVVLHDAKVADADLPRAVIRPYPAQYCRTWKGHNGTGDLTIRPIRPEDEPLMVEFHRTLSEESVYFRYFGPMKLDTRIAHDRLARMCFVDYDREIALVAERTDPSTGKHAILAVARLSRLKFSDVAEFAAIVSDLMQRKGLGTDMLKQLVEIARAEGCKQLRADILPFNKGMQRVCEKLGFTLTRSSDNETVEAVLEL